MSEKLTDREVIILSQSPYCNLSSLAHEVLAYRRAPAAPATPARDDLRAAATWALAAMDAVAGYEQDICATMDDDCEIGRIDSRHSPSFRIKVGHIRRLAAALRDAGGTDGAARDAQGGV